MPNTAAPIFPLRDAWLPILPLAPLLLAVFLLSGLFVPAGEGAKPEDALAFLMSDGGAIGAVESAGTPTPTPTISSHLVPKPQRNYHHLGDILTYYSLAIVHTLLCLAVIATFAHWMRRLPTQRAQGAMVFLAAMVGLAVAVVWFFWAEANEQELVLLGYKAICQLMAAADLPTDLVRKGQCFDENLTPLTWLAWIPTFAGMTTVAFAAAFAYATARNTDAGNGEYSRNDPAWREALEKRIKDLQRSVYLLSTVLVSSTVTISVFAHLPASLFASEKGMATAVSKYATGLSTFWGAIFSITLVGTFAAPALRLMAEAYGAENTASESGDLRHWLREHVFQSIRQQLGTVLSLMAPLMVGPLSSLLSSFSGF